MTSPAITPQEVTLADDRGLICVKRFGGLLFTLPLAHNDENLESAKLALPALLAAYHAGLVRGEGNGRSEAREEIRAVFHDLLGVDAIINALTDRGSHR